jgi:tRNA (guanine-N(7)-)-methyltransferase
LQTITDISYIRNIIESNSRSLPIEIEIGCGNGHFITEYKQTNRNILIGIDIKNKRCLKTLKKIKNRNLANIFIFRCKAEEFISNTPPLSIEKIHIYFPDPWPKNRHRKRRFFRMPQLDSMCACIKPKGSILFATDMFDYYLQAKVLIALHKDLIISNSIPPKELYNSVFGKKFAEDNKMIYFVQAEKK